MITLQLRGAPTFQNGTFLIASFGLSILAYIYFMKNKPRLSIFISLCLCIITGIHSHFATSSPAGLTTKQRKNITWYLLGERADLPYIREIQKYVKPDQRILVIPYSPDIYIEANRLPIKKYHTYLSWEADYAKHSWNGYDRDICIYLPKEKPPIIYLTALMFGGILYSNICPVL